MWRSLFSRFTNRQQRYIGRHRQESVRRRAGVLPAGA
jgi:hypothetical protein